MGNNISINIIGAGPAGCALALRARQANLKVRIFEAALNPKVAPGETLHPGAEPLLKQLGLWSEIENADFHRHNGVWLEKNGIREFHPYGSDNNGAWKGLQVERKYFHSVLQQATEKRGVKLYRGRRPQELIINKGMVCGIRYEGKEYHASWTIDATGRNSWLAKKLELSTKIYSPPLSVRFGWNTSHLEELEGQPKFAFNEDGWYWQAPLGKNRISWVELKISHPCMKRPSGLDQTWYCRPDCIGPGYALVGDAASRLDPSSSHGILNAITSGIFLGHLLEVNSVNKISEKELINIYRSWILERFINDKDRLLEHYLSSKAGKVFSASLHKWCI